MGNQTKAINNRTMATKIANVDIIAPTPTPGPIYAYAAFAKSGISIEVNAIVEFFISNLSDMNCPNSDSISSNAMHQLYLQQFYECKRK